MEAALETIRTLAASGEPSRQKLMATLHSLAYSMENVNDTIHRYGHSNLQTAAVKICMDLGLFKLLAGSDTSLTVEELSQKTKAEAALLNRVLRYLASVGAVSEESTNRYIANHVTKNLSEKLAEAGVSHYFGTVAPMYQVLPSYLKRTDYRDPADEKATAFHDAWKTQLLVFQWFGEHPEHLSCFNDYMALRRTPDVSWLTVYPVTQEVKNSDGLKALLVNVGGGVGHQCAQFKSAFPEIPGRVILQDMPHSIEKALQTPGVENIVHDLFEPQPIQGAKFYHLRGVLHNHPPHKVQKLLKNHKSAMAPNSVLLIDEMVFPEKGLNFDLTSIDMAMLTAFASKERTEPQWREVFQEAGLELVKTYVYNAVSHETVMDVRLPRP